MAQTNPNTWPSIKQHTFPPNPCLQPSPHNKPTPPSATRKLSASNVQTWYRPYNSSLQVGVYGGNVIGRTDASDADWHHVAAVLPDGEDNAQDVLLYVDGQEETPGGSTACTIDTDNVNGTDLRIAMTDWRAMKRTLTASSTTSDSTAATSTTPKSPPWPPTITRPSPMTASATA